MVRVRFIQDIARFPGVPVTNIRAGTEMNIADTNTVNALVRNNLAEVVLERRQTGKLTDYMAPPSEASSDTGAKREKAEAARKPVTAFERFLGLVGSHLVEIYGEYGTGKSRLVHHIAVEAQSIGKRVLYLDTEGGLADDHVKMLRNYQYVGDELDDLIEAVAWAKNNRDKYDLLVVDSVGHPVYVSYVELKGMDAKLRVYQELATVFRDMVRFARGERDKDFGNRTGLAIAVNHTVSEFERVADYVIQHQPIPPEALSQPLRPFGGQIQRVPKLILRSEPDGDGFRLVVFKARDLAKGLELARFSVGEDEVRIEWKI
ncbi:MAG: AAA family ATPase [Candidatus Hadarchaeales archaeon]